MQQGGFSEFHSHGVDSANKHGILLEVVQVPTDLNLNINKAYVSSDGSWFMDVFHVTDENGNKLTDEGVIGYIEKTLATIPCILPSFEKSVGVEVAADQHTAIELTGTDRPGLLSEIFVVLSDLKCNVVEAEVWTHNGRVACLVCITNGKTGSPIEDGEKICKIEELLRNVTRGNSNIRGAKTVVSMGLTHTERRLHRLMFADRDYEKLEVTGGRAGPLVTVANCFERDGSFVTVIPIKESINQAEKLSCSRILLSACLILCAWFPLAHKLKSLCASKASSEQHTCEDDMLYCSLCEVEIFKYSKHCRVCDKCVDGFDHHCRWINNCIGRKNYKEFFALMVSALFLENGHKWKSLWKNSSRSRA